MEKLHKEPDTYRRDYNAFVNELKQFHHNRGTQFRHVPRINGREIDLYSLYNQVTAQGGWQKVNDSSKWEAIFDNLKLAKGCVNSSLALKQIYIRYLGLYEKIHYLGEDPDDENGQHPDSRSRKQQSSLYQLVPMSYNYAQHEISDSTRAASSLCQRIVRQTEYDKICLSLLSGLPNEQEFALNICTILSNEGNHVLHLEQLPRLVDLLLAQAGIWRKDDPALQAIFLECWKETQSKNVDQFWCDVLDTRNVDATERYGQEKKHSLDDNYLFDLGEELGARNSVGQRILKVALILHNLSYEKHNVPVLASNSNFLRFLSYCMHCKWSCLQRIALDTFGNLASQVKLSLEDDDLCTGIIFRTVLDGIKSQDRFIVIRSMEILSKLSHLECNQDVITSKLDTEAYMHMVRLLTIPDVMLLIYTLEALYAISDFGNATCEKIVQTCHSIGALVSLLTLEPSSYGTGAQTGMKLVETFEPVPITESPLPTSSAKIFSAGVSTSQNSADVDSETFACNWLKGTYELCHGYSISRNDIYADYVTHCSKAGRKAVINANSFANCVRNVFPHCGLKRTESSTGIITFHHDGLRRRHSSSKVTMSDISKSSHGKSIQSSQSSSLGTSRSHSLSPNPTHSPILKAQLSAPPRPVPSVPQIHPQLKQALSRQPSVSPSPPPSPHHPSPSTTPTPVSNNAGSSTLIKSLLASKVTRNLQRQQLLQQQSSSINSAYECNQKRPQASPSNAVLSSMGIISPSQQGKLMPKSPQRHTVILSKEQTLSSTPISSQALKQGQVANVTKATKSIKSPCRPGTVISTSARLNGLPREIQLELCSTVEEAKETLDSRPVQQVQLNQAQNHLADKNVSSAFEANSNRIGNTQETDHGTEGEKIEVLQGAKYVVDTKESTTTTTNLYTPFLSIASPKNCNPNSNVQSNITNQSFLKSKSQVPVINSTFHQDIKSQNGSGILSESSASPPKISSPHVLKTVLGVSELEEDENTKKRQMDKVYKSSPLLNGLLDRGKIALVLDKEQITNIVQNGGSTCGTSSKADDGIKESKLFESDSSCSSSSAVDSRNIVITNHTNGENVSQDKGNVQSVEQSATDSPENSNLVSDLSSISDIARTLESASKAISQTNIECHANVPFSTSVSTTGTTHIIRTSPQITVVQPSPQVRLQQSNITLRFLYTIPRRDDSSELIGFPRVSINQLNQLRQQTESNSTAAKRPSTDCTSASAVDVKRTKQENKVTVLETNVHCPLTAISPVIVTTKASNNVNQETKSFQTTKLQKSEQSRPPSANSTDSESSKESQLLSQAVTDNSSSTNTTTTHSKVPSKLEFLCEWKGCNRSFKTPTSVLYHASKTHLPPPNEESTCKWENCDSMKRKRLSLLTHLQDWHCNENVLQIQALRRQQIAQHGKSVLAPPQPPPPHPGYAPDAALLAIRRHALQLVSTPEIKLEDKEDALTKSIRLTSALILRNLVENSPLARSYLKRYESDLMTLATASLESSRTIAHCLSELARPHE